METQPEMTQQVEKPRTGMGMTIALVVIGLALLGTLAWGFKLNSTLTKTHDANLTLQADYKKLTGERDAVSAELEIGKADFEKLSQELEKAKKELATAESDVASTTKDTATRRANIEKAIKYIDLGAAFYDDSQTLDDYSKKVTAINDPQLKKRFDAFFSSFTNETYQAMMLYIFQTAYDLLQ